MSCVYVCVPCVDTHRAAWDAAVVKPLEAAAEATAAASGPDASDAATAAAGRGYGTPAGIVLAEWGRAQLLGLMSRIMIRSCKSDLALLPPCYKKVRVLRQTCGKEGRGRVCVCAVAVTQCALVQG